MFSLIVGRLIRSVDREGHVLRINRVEIKIDKAHLRVQIVTFLACQTRIDGMMVSYQ